MSYLESMNALCVRSILRIPSVEVCRGDSAQAELKKQGVLYFVGAPPGGASALGASAAPSPASEAKTQAF
jgi:hypothetical protein